MQNLFDELTEVLSKDDRLVIEGKLAKNKIVELALKLDADLLKLLLSNDTLKSRFFSDVDGTLVFDKYSFQRFVANKQFLPDSFTAFKNRIGLSDNGEDYLSEKNDVSLIWPYKDCVLEGGQTKEDSKRKEVFWNETLAPDEIDRLLDPKALTNFTTIDKSGELTTTDFSIKDNFLLKGNNLLALHSIAKIYREKAKLIYIDPPYNTGKDSFGYNDKFNHSSWLTFMKNRLSVAKLFLKKDGVIFVHCDNNEQAYLKVLMDEIFGPENFVDTITVVNNPRGRDYGGIANMHEFIHVYARDFSKFEMYRMINKEKKFPYKDDISEFEIRELRNRNTAFNDKNRPNLCYPFYVNPKNEVDNGFLEISLEKKKGFVEVWPAKSQGIQTVWRWGKEKSEENLNVNIVGKAMQEDGRYMIVEKYRDNTRLARSVWWDKEVNSEKGTIHLRELFGKKIFNFPKPETLMSRIIEISTKENDLVLDFHLGSGTTATTAHKMGRQYIGIEQMDYINDVTVERLKKVISGEQGGISETVKWEGGGSFVYAELMEFNAMYLRQIQDADSAKELLDIWDKIQEKAFLSFQVDPKSINKERDSFESLSVDEQKQFLIETLDKNQLYVNYSEIEDEEFDIPDDIKELNRKFYSLSNK